MKDRLESAPGALDEPILVTRDTMLGDEHDAALPVRQADRLDGPGGPVEGLLEGRYIAAIPWRAVASL
jgi:hypothetical protein